MFKLNTTEQDILKAAKIIRSGGVVAYPTDTAYALGCDFQNKAAIKKILQIKKRKDTKFTLIAGSVQQSEKYFSLTEVQKKILKKYWPGPLSLAVNNRFSVRVPDSKTAKLLAKKSKTLLLATSANMSGESEAYSSLAVIKKFKNAHIKPDAVIMAGSLPHRKVSTIVKISKSKIIVIRQGAVKIKQIKS